MHHRLAPVGAAMTFFTTCLAVMAAAVLVTLAPGANAASHGDPACDALVAPAGLPLPVRPA